MRSIFDRLADRLLSRLGLELDFSIDLRSSVFSQINPSLYLGARPGTEHVEALKQIGVTDIVSCLTPENAAQVAFLRRDFRHLFIGIRDGMDENIAGTFERFFDFAREATEQSREAKLLVHCEVGVSRSAALAVAWVMKTEDIGFFDALTRVRSKRIEVLPNIGFASQLQRLEHQLQPDSENRDPSSLALYLQKVCSAPAELEVLQSSLEQHDYDAAAALSMIFGGEIPRVVQGVRS